MKVDASAGLGRWSEAPWLAVLHKEVTTSAQAGFYPVYLYEPGFKTVCLVLGQGSDSLESTFGKKKALAELEKRARILRDCVKPWPEGGFTTGPFTTRKSAAGDASDEGEDPWSASVAVGKRYVLADLPPENELARDAKELIAVYRIMAANSHLQFAKLDHSLEELKEEGEIPKTETVDGAKKIFEHKQFERRVRNAKLIRSVKRHLGVDCQACGTNLEDKYGPVMAGYIEAHHKVPVSSLPETGAVLEASEGDFMVLCSNCHRAIHRAGCPDLETFRELLRANA